MQSKSLLSFSSPGTYFDNIPGLFFDQNADGGGAGAGNGTGSPASVTKQYTQDDLDRMFSERATRAAQSAREDMLKKFGVKDDEELTTLLTDGKKLKESQMSEIEKFKTDKQTADDALATEKTAHAETVKNYTERLLKAEIKAKAQKAGFRDESLDDVWMLASTKDLRAKITEKDDAFVGVDAVVEEIKKAKPFWLAGETEKKPKTPGSPRFPRKAGDNTPEPPKRTARSL